MIPTIITPRFISKLFFCGISPSKRTKIRFLIILCDKLVISSVSGIWIKHKVIVKNPPVYRVTKKYREYKDRISRKSKPQYLES